MKTAAAMTLVHRPALSPSAVCTTARVLTISPLSLNCCSRSSQCLVGVERNVQRRREHRGGKVFNEIFGFLFAHPVPVVLGDVAIRMVSRDRQANARADQAVGLIGRRFGQDDEGDLPRLELGLAFLHRDDFADGRIDRGNAHEILLFDARVAQRQLKALQLVDVTADALREENFLGTMSWPLVAASVRISLRLWPWRDYSETRFRSQVRAKTSPRKMLHRRAKTSAHDRRKAVDKISRRTEACTIRRMRFQSGGRISTGIRVFLISSTGTLPASRRAKTFLPGQTQHDQRHFPLRRRC